MSNPVTMNQLPVHLKIWWRRSIRWVLDLPVGTSWGRTQPGEVQRNLRWFWFDGLFSSASESIVGNFVSLYILALGATQAQIGLMSSISNLAGAILLLPGAFLAQHAASRKRVAVLTGGGVARIALLSLVFVPILFKGWNLVWIAIALSVIRDSMGNLGYPSWMTVTHEIVPMEGRGRFFGARNFVMGVTGIIFTLLAGKLISIFVAPLGYQIALGIAFVLGASSTFSYLHINETTPEVPPPPKPVISIKKLSEVLHGQSQFVAVVLTSALWNFSINITGPFFNVYLVQNLKFSTAVIGFLAVISSISGLFVQNKIGAIADRLGPRRLQLVSMALIPLLPLAWTLASQVWQIALINLAGGILWGAFNLAQFNLLLASMPKDQIPRFSAIYQIVITLSLSAGALAGSYVIKHWGFVAIFLISALLRWVATGLFARFVQAADAPRLKDALS